MESKEDCKDWKEYVSIVISEVRAKKRQKLNETVSIDVRDEGEHDNVEENDEDDDEGNQSEEEEEDQENEEDEEQAETQHEKAEENLDPQQESNQQPEQTIQESESKGEETLLNVEPLNEGKDDQNLATTQNESEESGKPETPKELPEKKSVTFEFLKEDSNTDKELLENITMDETNHFTEDELKANVFNSYKTIETLQGNLM